MTRINQTLKRMRSTNSTDTKIMLLQSLRRDKIAEEVLIWALNPYITFGINISDDKLFSSFQLDDSFLTFKRWEEFKRMVLVGLYSRKLTGNNARARIESYKEFNPLLTLIINKDLRAGINIALVNRAIPGLIPTFKAGAAADMRKGATPKYPLIAEPKFDGVRVLAMFGPSGNVQLMSRGGREYKNFPYILADLEKLDLQNKILDGEVYGDTFDMTMQVAHRGRSKEDNSGVDDKDFIFNVFDFMDLDEFESEVCSYTYTIRRSLLENFLKETEYIKLTKIKQVHNEEEMLKYRDEIISLGYEGLILKHPEGTYPFKRTTQAWIKAKVMHDYDGIVIGHYEGKGKFVGTLGGLEVSIGGIITKVGSGFSDDARRTIWNNAESIHGLKITVQGQELTKDGCVRFPVFKRFKDEEVLG